MIGCSGLFVRSAHRSHLITQGPVKQDGVSVSIQVLDPDETKDVFDIDLIGKGIQPLLIKIKNDGTATYRFSKSDVDAHYIPAATASTSAYENPVAVGRQVIHRIFSSAPELIFTPRTRAKTPPRPIFNETVRQAFMREEIPDREIGPTGSLEGFLYVQPLQPDSHLAVKLINNQTQQPLLFEFPLAEVM